MTRKQPRKMGATTWLLLRGPPSGSPLQQPALIGGRTDCVTNCFDWKLRELQLAS